MGGPKARSTSTCSGRRTMLITVMPWVLPSRTIIRPKALAAALLTSAACLPRCAMSKNAMAVSGLTISVAARSRETSLETGMQRIAVVTAYSAQAPP
jgi:hypothetical protein